MPPIRFTVRYQGPVPVGTNLGQREFNNLLREAWDEVGGYWFEQFLPKHFTKQGAREYGYAPRKGELAGTSGKAFWRSYTGEKQRKFGHTLPLVFTGQSNGDSLINQCKTANVYATSKGVRVALSGARKANFRNPNSNIDMADELTRVSAGEVRELERVFDSTMQRLLDQIIIDRHANTVAGWHHANDTINT